MRIAFLRTGQMATELALRLTEPGGHKLTRWNRTKDKTIRVVETGVEVVDDPRQAVRVLDLLNSTAFGWITRAQPSGLGEHDFSVILQQEAE